MRGPSVSDDTEARAEWARIGVELRREGKLPPLREPERWGVWCETSRVDQCGWYFGMAGSVRVDTTFSSREKAQEHAELMACTGDVYTVKPYPDAKQTSETLAPPRTETAPPLPAAMHTGSPSAEGGAAKVERCGPGCTCVYCGHRLAGERRRAELVAERPKWVTRLAEVTDRLAVIDRELDRLDRTGEVK